MAPSLPHILIHEYFSGGGWPEPVLPADLASEGLAMLRAVLTDFQAWGGAVISTTRDRRLAGVSLPADRVINLTPRDHSAVLEQLAGQYTAALIIAPETDGILARLSTLIERGGARLLGSLPDSIDKAANKWSCHRLFSQSGLPTPDTWRVNLDNALETAGKVGFPLVAKPLDGVGCEGVILISDVSALKHVLDSYRTNNDRFLLQRYIKGHHASVSVLAADGGVLPLSLNRQSVKAGAPFRYQGGEVPFNCDKQEQALDLAKRAAVLLPGLRGYFGVDMVITERRCCLIEINPRLTTSYIGLRRVVNFNLAEAIWNAATRSVLPGEVRLSGKANFSKENLI